MPTGVYVRTKETRNKMSKVHKGKIFSEEHKNNLSKVHKGRKEKPFSEEHKRNIGLAKIGNKYASGYKHTEETKRLIGLAHLGKPLSEEHKNNLSKAHKGKNKGKHWKLSEETKKLMGLAKKGDKNPAKCPEVREKMKINRSKQILPVKDTKIEVKIQNYLNQLNVDYYKHEYIHIKHAYQCDFFIPSKNLVIECDGNYWHKYPTGRDIDKIRTQELIEKGFKVLRLWEHEIKVINLNGFKERLDKVF